MRKLSLLLALAMLVIESASGLAQTTTGTIRGRVVDARGLALPGVTVNMSSPNLQGVRAVVTEANGDYIVARLPPGTYTIAFELSGFETTSKTASVAPTSTIPVDATLGVAGVKETVEVVGTTADVLTKTAQVATDFKQELIATLPTNRDLREAQRVDDDAGGGRELGEGSDLRPGGEPVRVPVAAHVPLLVRRAVLGSRDSGSRGTASGPGRFTPQGQP